MIDVPPSLRVHLIAQAAAGGRSFRLVGIVDPMLTTVVLTQTLMLCAPTHACRKCKDFIDGIPHIELGVIHGLDGPPLTSVEAAALSSVEVQDVWPPESATPAATDGSPQ